VSQYLPFVVIGLTTGSVYALIAVGLVVTYRTSQIFNFAIGSLATVTVLLFYALVYRAQIPWQIAAAIAILGIGPAVGAAFQVLGSRLSPLTTESKVLATIGLILFISGAVTLWGAWAFGAGAETTLPPSLPRTLVRVLGVNVGVDQIIIVVVGLVVTLLLHLVLEYTKVGRSMRAVADNPDLVALTGKSPTSAQRAGWALGIGFVTLAGLMLVISPSNSVSVYSLNLLVLQAFGAAAIGGFTSLPLTYVGALGIGIAGALSTKWVAQIPVLGGVPASLPFLILFVVLVAFPRHLAPQTDPRTLPHRPRVVEVSRMWQAPLAALVVAAFVIVPLTRNVQLVYTANEALPYAIIFLGLGLLVRTSGQVSLCQMGLAGIGAAIFAHVAGAFGVPWFAAVILGGLAAAAIGAVVAIPAIRVAGVYLAIATFGFAVLLEQFLYPMKPFFGEQDVTAPRPVIGPINFGDNETYFVLLSVLFLVCLVAVTALRGARLGRLLRGLGDSPVALEALGTSINFTRVAVFTISAFFAGIGGALLVSQVGFLEPTPFASMSSLTVFVILLTIRTSEPIASLGAAAAMIVVPSFLSNRGQVWWLDIGFGAAAVVVALTGSATWLPRWRWAPARLRVSEQLAVSESPQRPRPSAGDRRDDGLVLRDVSVRFGGVVAVDHVSIEVPMGRTTGLIGPNGAGKTTVFNFCSGLVRGHSGSVRLAGRDITSLSAPGRARAGIGRTFQQANLFESLTVRENIELGVEGAMAGAHLVTHVVATPSQAAQTRERAMAAMALVGIESLANREVRSLSTSEKRLVELSRCLAGDFQVLLLDEPSSGLDSVEAGKFGEVLTRVVDQRGLGVLFVEHNMSLVLDICSYVYVMDFGELIFAGPPSDVLESDSVRMAYLGVSQSDAADLAD
jgi:ABC-type branched-subunit amino acid transport system ATPase component/branched-subunit amino acid ABC-type transport system permease component